MAGALQRLGHGAFHEGVSVSAVSQNDKFFAQKRNDAAMRGPIR